MTPAKPSEPPLAGGSPLVGRDEYDIPVEPDEKPETCDDFLCDASIKRPRKLKRPRRAVSREWRDKKWGWLELDGTALRKKVLCRQGRLLLDQWRSTCAKCCPKRPGALHRLIAATRVERDDVSHRDFNHALETQCTDNDDTRETEDEFAREMLELEDIHAVNLVDEGPTSCKKGPRDCGRENGFRSPALLVVIAPR